MFGWNRKQRRSRGSVKRGVGWTRQFSSKRARLKYGRNCLGHVLTPTATEETTDETVEETADE